MSDMVSVRLPKPLNQSLKSFCQRYRKSQSEIIIQALAALLSNSSVPSARENSAVRNLKSLRKKINFKMDFEFAEEDGRD